MRWRWHAAPAATCNSTGTECRCCRVCKALAAQGFVTGASGRNWAGYGADVQLPAGFAAEDQALLTDPQTSGGLLVAVEPAALDAVLAIFSRHGFASAAVVGRISPAQGRPALRVA